MSLPAKRPGHQCLITMEHAADVVRDAEGVRRRAIFAGRFFLLFGKKRERFCPLGTYL